MISLERWKTLSRRDQLGHTASEIKRAMAAVNATERQDMIGRAIALIDLSLLDDRFDKLTINRFDKLTINRFDKLTIKKWRINPLMLLRLREELAAVYVGKEQDLQRVYAAL